MTHFYGIAAGFALVLIILGLIGGLAIFAVVFKISPVDFGMGVLLALLSGLMLARNFI